MMQAIFKRLFHIQEMIFVLSLTALACLPFALSELMRDAGMSLLLPITVFGLILAWVLAGLGVRRSLSGFVLLFLGPLALYIRIGQMGGALFEFIRQWFLLIPSLFNALFYKTPLDLSFLLLATDELTQKIFGFSGRLSLWLTGIFQWNTDRRPCCTHLYLEYGSLADRGLGGLANLSQQKIYAGHASIHGFAGFRCRLHGQREDNPMGSSCLAFIPVWID